MVTDMHALLVERAVAWLRRQGCRSILADPFVANTCPNEKPDAIGWRDGVSLLVECKASRADFLRDRRKPFRADPSKGMGDWRFMMAPAGMIAASELPEGWGLLEWDGARIVPVAGVPLGNCNWHSGPFMGMSHKRNETRMLVSALSQQAARPQPVDTKEARRGLYAGWNEQLGAQ